MTRAADRTADDHQSTLVAVTFEGDSEAAARRIAAALGLPFRSPADATALEGELILVHTASKLELHEPATGIRLWVEYTPAELRRYLPGAGRDLLRRALGTKVRRVADATAGLGRDAVHLACLGYVVTAIERNVIVAALAQDGLNRARAAGLLPHDNPAWSTADAYAVLPTLDPPPEAVYIDPMFPPKRKHSAAVRKEMRLLRALVHDDRDALDLLTAARACATDRVVVKRPDDAPPLAPNPTATYAGKLVRYDVYRTVRKRSS